MGMRWTALAVLLAFGGGARAIPWSVALHGGEIQHNASLAPKVAELTKELGAVGVRIDVFWDEIQPLENETLCHGGEAASRCAFYSAFFRSAVASGLRITPILSSPPAWAKHLLTNANATAAFLGAWRAYVTTAISLIIDAGASANVDAYQLWNEMNHVPSSWINHNPDAVCAVFNVAAGAIQAAAGNTSSTPPPPRFVNVMADDPLKVAGMQPWEAAVSAWLDPGCAGGVIDGVGIDHYPGTWTLDPAFTAWKPLDKLLANVNDPSNAAWYGKLPAVMETGFSSWNSVLASEHRQSAWVNQSLAALRSIVLASQQRPFPVRHLCYYQLVDVSTAGGSKLLQQEDHFGIVHSDFTPKDAFGALRAQLALF